MGAGVPKGAKQMHDMLDQFSGFLNKDLPKVGAFHEAVDIGDA